MERIDEKSGSERRRELRRSLEQDVGRFSLNDIMLAGIVIIAMVLSLTDFTFSLGDFKNFTALTLFLYVVTTIVYRNRYHKGKLRGRSDAEYIEALNDYKKAKNKIAELGIASYIPTFCQEYKAKELKEYRKGILADVDLDYDEYMKEYRHLSNRRIMRLPLPRYTRKAIIKCNKAKPVKLTPGLIMNESGEASRQKLISQSGRDRERRDKFKNFLSKGFVIFFGGAIVVNIIFDFSFIAIAQWFVRMLPIFSAIIMGDDEGFCDIAVTETHFKKDQTTIINLLFEQYKESAVTPTDE